MPQKPQAVPDSKVGRGFSVKGADGDEEEAVVVLEGLGLYKGQVGASSSVAAGGLWPFASLWGVDEAEKPLSGATSVSSVSSDDERSLGGMFSLIIGNSTMPPPPPGLPAGASDAALATCLAPNAMAF